MRALLGALPLLAMACVASGPRRSPDDSGPRAPGALVWRYTVRADADLARLEVVACFGGAAPEALVPGLGGAAVPLEARGWDAHGPFPMRVGEGGVLRLPSARRDVCVAYHLDLGQVLARGDRDTAFRVGRDVVLAPDLLLWRPRRVPDDVAAQATFELPAGLAVSAPWPRVLGHADTYRLDASAFAWRGQLALGRFTPETLAFSPESSCEVVLLDGPTRTSATGRARWLEAAAGAVASVAGAFPREHLQVVIAPTSGGGDDPIHFGYVLRGGGAAITLLLDGDASDDDLADDWVAVHELFHLTMPPIRRDDAWLSEGVTMYFTELLRVRAGFISARAGFAALHDGFRRGRADGTGRTLEAESSAMHATHAYRRVYWAGAAIALQADLALRRRVGRGLASVLAELRACCARSARFWSADEVVARLDALAGAPVFAESAARWLAVATFPDLGDAYRELGLDPTTGAPDSAPENAALRNAIMPSEPAQ